LASRQPGAVSVSGPGRPGDARASGRHIARRLLADGERVVDVPPKLSARTRVFAAGQGRKTDVTDAHSVALAASRVTGPRPVTDDQQFAVLRILAGRRRLVGEDYTRMISSCTSCWSSSPRGAQEPVGGPGQTAAGQGPPAGRGRADHRPGARLPAEKAANKELTDLRREVKLRGHAVDRPVISMMRFPPRGLTCGGACVCAPGSSTRRPAGLLARGHC
jgi:hypothetical protein